MKLVSWNVNGLRACVDKGFLEFLRKEDPDIICLQEIKMLREQGNFDLSGYEEVWYSAEKKGYSGTAVFTKIPPINVSYGLGIEEHDKEGRVITCEFKDFFLVNCYTPNSKQELLRLDYRMIWEDAFRAYLEGLDKIKPVVICGDLNVAHKEIDLKNPSTNKKNAGFTNEERGKFTELLSAGFTDSFRHFNPELEGAYSWWSYRFKAREKNAGWRIDYFLVSDRMKDRLQSADILSNVLGSDHCPVRIEIN